MITKTKHNVKDRMSKSPAGETKSRPAWIKQSHADLAYSAEKAENKLCADGEALLSSSGE